MARRTKFLTICGNIIIFVVVANTINLLAREINKYYIALYKPIYNKIWEEKESKSKTNTIKSPPKRNKISSSTISGRGTTTKVLKERI